MSSVESMWPRVEGFPSIEQIQPYLFPRGFFEQWLPNCVTEVSADSLRERVEALTDDNFKVFVERVFKQAIEDGSDPEKVLGRLLPFVTAAKVQTLFQNQLGKGGGEFASDHLEEAICYTGLAPTGLQALSKSAYAALQTVCSVVDAIVTAFGIADFFRSAHGIEAEFKGQKILMILSLFGMISGVLIPLLGPVLGSAIVGGLFLSIALLSLIWPAIRPRPTSLPHGAEHWTEQVTKSDYRPVQYRREKLQEIAAALQQGKHVLLVGPSRAGKTAAAHAFTAALHAGKFPLLTAGREAVFYFNSANLVGQQASFLGGNPDPVGDIRRVMGRHADEITLVFDELQAICQTTSLPAQRMKTALDNGGAFRHVIGITTDAEYDAHIARDPALANRFVRIDVGSASREQTISRLTVKQLRDGNLSELRTREALGTLIDEDGEAVQPHTAEGRLGREQARFAGRPLCPEEGAAEEKQPESALEKGAARFFGKMYRKMVKVGRCHERGAVISEKTQRSFALRTLFVEQLKAEIAARRTAANHS